MENAVSVSQGAHGPSPAPLLRDARRRHGLSQARLAKRAGTTQSAISRIERGKVSPSFETVGRLLHLMGEDLTVGAQPRDFGIDRTQIRERFKSSPEERVDYGLAFADMVIASSPNVRGKNR